MYRKEIVLFGAGKLAEKFIYQYFEDINIKCLWDNKKTGKFLGYLIEKPRYCKKCFIIVTSSSYLEIREQLIGMGYHEFDDFIPVQIFKKKIAIAYGNCHMNAVKLYLECHKEFGLEYGFYPFPAIQTLKDINLKYESIIENCDLIFHQSIRKDNVYGEAYSSNRIIKDVKKTCKIISVPNLYGLPKYLFPQLETHGRWQHGSFCPFFIDSNVIKWLKKGLDEEQIKKFILEGGVYAKTEILAMWEEFKLKLIEREQEWDIKISDYIFDNYRKERIFCDINHITSKTAQEIALRILKYMGYKKEIFLELPIMDDMESLIYKDVKNALNLEFDDYVIRKNSFGNVSLNSYEMSAEEYISQLCKFTRFCLKKETIKTS